MQQVVETRVPSGHSDKRAHCLAGAYITYYCSRFEAEVAAAGKEWRDALGEGDAEAADWQAARSGIACSALVPDSEALQECCRTAGW